MAIETVVVPGLTWEPLDAGGQNLIARLEMDFRIYNAYRIEPGGAFRAGVVERATGVVFDNLSGPDLLTVRTGAFWERIPPFTRQLMVLPTRAVSLEIGGLAGVVYATFFRGQYPGNPNGVNFPEAFGA